MNQLYTELSNCNQKGPQDKTISVGNNPQAENLSLSSADVLVKSILSTADLNKLFLCGHSFGAATVPIFLHDSHQTINLPQDFE